MRRTLRITPALLLIAFVGCAPKAAPPPAPPVDDGKVPVVKIEDLPGHGSVSQDNQHKESPRLVPAETYIRSYLKIFGGLAPLDAQRELQAGSGLFDTWSAYLGALGLPNYAQDLPRGEQTNSVMVAAFDRLGIALCDRALERDLKASPLLPAEQRLVFAFDVPVEPIADVAEFAPRFDLLHRTFLSYPAKLAPTDRTNRFFALYKDTAAAHTKDPKLSRFTPAQAGLAAVCQGLARHPEFHLY